jgi:hypothetical protein
MKAGKSLWPTLLFSLLGLAFWASSPAGAQAPPLPVFDNIQIQALCTYDPSSQTYRYEYFVTNPPTNTIRIWTIDLLVGESLSLIALPPRAGENDWYSGEWQGERGTDQVPKEPHISWTTSSFMTNLPEPGTTSGPLAFTAPVPPAILECWVQPRLHLYFQQYLDATGQEEIDPEEQEAIENSYIRKLRTLGPLPVSPGGFAHWDKFIADVGQAAQLGWISDASLLTTLQSHLTAARQAALDQDLLQMHSHLQAVMDAINASTPAQRTQEAYALVFYNASYLQDVLPWPCEPKLVLTPKQATHSLGQTHTLEATLTNVATSLPIANNSLFFEVTDGPHAGLALSAQTDQQGKASFSYQGVRLGTDTLRVSTPSGTIRQKGQGQGAKSSKSGSGAKPASSITECFAWDISQEAQVEWQGGPDLTVPFLFPPVFVSAPGRTVPISDETQNQGNVASPASVTRYYIYTQQPFDPSQAVVVGQRQVPPLAPGEVSAVERLTFTVPASLPPGRYYLDACADADGQVPETNENNNCASSSFQLLVPLAPANQPPVCTLAQASPALLWPPNHKLAAVSIVGVSDPDGDPVSLTITGITQDEPTNGLGDGDTCPDGFGVGQSQAQVRAERSGLGNGRVYRIAFTASDGKGGSCTGSVTVGVPHDRKDTPIDDGQSHDATRCP